MSMQKFFMGIALSLLIINLNLFSQIVLEGDVTSAGMDQEPVQNALVELIDQDDTTRVFSSTTDEQGHYSIQITETAVGDASVQKPGAFKLLQNYPNPFNPSTVISYECPHPAHIRIEIYNVLGQKIKTLFDGFQSDPFGRVVWDGTNDHGQGVSAGVYIYSLKTVGIRINKKMLLFDGHTGISNFAYSNTMGGILSNKNVLNKPLSNIFLLRVTGTDIETWELQDLQITKNMVLNVSVYFSMTDIDGNVYPIVKIGNQWWMADNLKVTQYRNGDAIPHVTDNTEWRELFTGAYCYYDNDISNAEVYGALYNWYVVNDSRNIAPEGWHVPSAEEWLTLADYLGGADVAGGKLKETGTTHWTSPNEAATNESGFTALPGGCRRYSGGFYEIGNSSYWWSSTSYYNPIFSTNNALIRYIFYNHSNFIPYNERQEYGYSVRCLKDN
ncbi:T9SS type A sorting domain-containing protein [candidate division KSB1 bacterium]|nr:T9SS type A sorting domain-containing protein [candidate division KSB1 bacterium]